MILALGLIVAAFLLGSVPFGMVLARTVAGVDVRAAGSGNIGATNVARLTGKKLGIATLVLDALKGLVPVLLVRFVLGPRFLAPGLEVEVATALVGGAAFLGHCFSVFLRFKGGKGVATALGVLLGVAPIAALSGTLVYGALFAAFKISSVGSLAAALVVLPVTWLTAGPVYAALVAMMVAVVVLKHRGNIRRLLGRTEHKV
jgi:acyl phosphate:glycerol-3-phosphate acyltransferase